MQSQSLVISPTRSGRWCYLLDEMGYLFMALVSPLFPAQDENKLVDEMSSAFYRDNPGAKAQRPTTATVRAIFLVQLAERYDQLEEKKLGGAAEQKTDEIRMKIEEEVKEISCGTAMSQAKV